MKVMEIPIVISELGTVSKSLVRGLEELEIGGRTETIKTPSLLRSGRILSRNTESRRFEETYSLSDLSERSLANTGVKN